MTDSHYFDYAAATPVDERVIKAMQPYWQQKFYNPSAPYLAAKQVHKDLVAARETVAKIIGARPAEVIFTAGGTESDNLAIKGIMDNFPGGHLIVSAIEHEAVLAAANKYEHSLLPVDTNGRADTVTLEKLITDKTVLISVMHANNEVGTIQPLSRISKLISEVLAKRRKSGNKRPLYLHSDASQTANYLDLHVHRLGVDLLTLNGGKIYGPKQTGALFVASGVKLSAQQLGGGQEHGLRSGTENMAGIIGFATALQLAQSMHKDEAHRLVELQQYFISELSNKLPTFTLNGKNCLPNFVHLTLQGIDNERVVMELDEQGIQCAMGSACSASNEEPSHVLKAMGRSESDARSSLRFSMGRGTTKAAIKDAVDCLAKICA